MPLLISSRMTSAGLTASSSASSLTVIVVGSSIAPRSRGSATWTGARLAPSRRGGFRGPRLPRVPLLLLATFSSFGRCHQSGCPGRHRLAQLRRDRRLQRSSQRASIQRGGPAVGLAAEVRTPAGKPACLIDLQFASRRPDDPDELSLVAGGPAGDARSSRRSPYAGRVPAYDAPSASSAPAAGFFPRLFFGAAEPAATASGSGAGWAPDSSVDASVATSAAALTAFVARARGLAAGFFFSAAVSSAGT